MKKKIAILPLDNRPCCYDFTKRLGEMSQYEIIQPPSEIIGEFTYFGNTQAIIEWLRDVSGKVDGLVISIDQLLYGGLVPSRIMERTYDEVIGIAEIIKEIKNEHPNLIIYAVNVLMRISITAKNKLFSQYWKSIFQYSQAYDRVNRLKEVEYQNELDKVIQEIPMEILEEYLAARSRNHRVNQLMVDWVGEGIIDFLAITQEDASAIGIHITEQRELMKKIYTLKIQNRVLVYPGADEATQTLLARMLQRLDNLQLKIYPKYISGSGKLEVAKFEDRPVDESVTAHITAAGAVIVDHPDHADIILFVNTPVGSGIDGYDPLIKKAHFNSRHQLMAMVNSVKYYLSLGYRVSIADITFPNASDLELVQYLLEEDIYFELSGYAGWNTAGNSLGTCISHSLIKVLSEKEASLPIDIHHAFLLERLLDEWAYQASVRGEVNSWIIEELGIDGTNLENKYDDVNNHTKKLMQPYFSTLATYYEKYVNGKKNRQPRTPILHTCRLPWNRTFELQIKIELYSQTNS